MVDQDVFDSQLKADRFPSPRNMRAAQVGAFGGIEQLHLSSIPVPTPRRGEVLVRVGAAGVGPWDALVREGRSGLALTLPVTRAPICPVLSSRSATGWKIWRPTMRFLESAGLGFIEAG